MAADVLDRYMLLKAEVQAIGRDLRSRGADRVAIGRRIAKALDTFEALSTEAPVMEPGKQQRLEEKGWRIGTAEDFLGNTPSKILVKRVGAPGKCTDCGQEPCACFSHLPRPRVTVRPDRLVKVEFPTEFTPEDRIAWLRAMKMAIARRKG
jgi:hypothetical protein